MVTIRPSRAPALGEQLAATLRDQIVRRNLLPGTHLVEDALASEYDVSRGPVRDALRQLELQGLVESRRRGFFVVGLSVTDIEDLYELREAIELAALQLVVGRIGETGLAAGRVIVAEMIACADRAAVSDFRDADIRFHALLYRECGNRRLLDVWQSYEPVFASLMQLTVEEDIDLHPSAQDHARVIELIASGDVEAVTTATREHLAGARARMAHAVQTRFAAEKSEVTN